MSNKLVLKDVEVAFGQLAEAQTFNGQEGTSSYGVTVNLTPEQEAEFVKQVSPLFEEMMQAKMAALKAEGKSSKLVKGVFLKEGRNGEPRVNFKRKEKEGRPEVLGPDNKDADPKDVRRGAMIDVSFSMRPYVIQGMFNVTFVVNAVRLRGSKKLTAVDAATLFGDPLEEPVDKKKDTGLF